HLFVGAAPARTNYVLAHLRPRPNNAEKLAHIVRSISGAWEEHVRSEGGGTGAGRLDDERALHNVFLFEDIAAGAEQGFVLPLAGQEGAWAREHMSAFEARAGAGDEGMKVLVEEAKKLM
ncbi:hypothetical protein C7974DRAFT_291709, partial [Boeremia exigua]|uniref:uncharacterized protein n=1 Tax=Boeremia exigua TaxID=749465 RepID=UPI001E8DDD2F